MFKLTETAGPMGPLPHGTDPIIATCLVRGVDDQRGLPG